MVEAVTRTYANSSNSEFRILHLFYVLSFYSAGLAFAPGLIVLTTVWLGVAWLAAYQSTRRQAYKIWRWSVLLFLFGWCLLIAPVARYPTGYARRHMCRNNIQQLLLSMQDYQVANQFLPAARILDEDGKPAHSWRVLLLPFIGEERLYAEYRFDEPWDGPNNRKLAEQMPELYRCPAHNHGSKTHYKLVRGPGTAFEDGVSIDTLLIPDGASSTGAIVEDPIDAVQWMKPEDLTMEEAVRRFTDQKLEEIAHGGRGTFSDTYSGSNVGMLDGSIEWVGIEVAPAELERLFGIDNGIHDDGRLRGGRITRWKYGAIIACFIYIVLAAVPIVRIVTKEYRTRPANEDALPVQGDGVQ